MAKPLIDVDAMIASFETATARQGAQLKKTVSEATLAALQGRELTLKNIKGVLRQVSEAASTGLAKNVGAGVDPSKMLDQAVAGMDEALLKAVKANEVALGQLVAQGADLREKHLKKALDDLDGFEDMMFSALKKAASGAAVAGTPMAEAWAPVLSRLQAGGTQSGAQASQAVEQLTEQMQGAMRSTRAASMRAAQAMAESYAAMVSGVLLGMSEAFTGSSAVKTAAKAGDKK